MSYRETEGPAPVVVVALGGHVFGLDRRTGARLWEHEVGGRFARIAVTADRVLAAGVRLLCLEYPTGALLWTADLPWTAWTLLWSGGQILVAGSGEVACYSELGEQLWHDGFRGYGLSAVALGLPGVVAEADVSG
ncbi:MAG: PQQ-binding-like beta-propeller repeat protein [Polyangiaceae bacterium]|nr:PQQ-binding-like beta-propeller repeat protein [Polyangiaceae bacterium]